MTPYKQLNRHNPSAGIIGDCWRTCIACLLEMPPETVPHFCDGVNWNNPEASKKSLDEWLKERFLSMIEIPYHGPDLQGVLNFFQAVNPDTYYLLGGNSRNGCGHSVICLNDSIFWDPSLDDSGIVRPMDDGFYWVSFIVPRWHRHSG